MARKLSNSDKNLKNELTQSLKKQLKNKFIPILPAALINITKHTEISMSDLRNEVGTTPDLINRIYQLLVSKKYLGKVVKKTGTGKNAKRTVNFTAEMLPLLINHGFLNFGDLKTILNNQAQEEKSKSKTTKVNNIMDKNELNQASKKLHDLLNKSVMAPLSAKDTLDSLIDAMNIKDSSIKDESPVESLASSDEDLIESSEDKKCSSITPVDISKATVEVLDSQFPAFNDDDIASDYLDDAAEFERPTDDLEEIDSDSIEEPVSNTNINAKSLVAIDESLSDSLSASSLSSKADADYAADLDNDNDSEAEFEISEDNLRSVIASVPSLESTWHDLYDDDTKQNDNAGTFRSELDDIIALQSSQLDDEDLIDMVANSLNDFNENKDDANLDDKDNDGINYPIAITESLSKQPLSEKEFINQKLDLRVVCLDDGSSNFVKLNHFGNPEFALQLRFAHRNALLSQGSQDEIGHLAHVLYQSYLLGFE